MTPEQIQQNNELIARFMGGVHCEYPEKIFPGEYGYQFPQDVCKSGWWNVKNLSFHSSWDWLMPVGKKIFDWIQSDIKERPPHTLSQGDWLECEISIAIREYELRKAHKAIIDFIIWYNEQNKQP